MSELDKEPDILSDKDVARILFKEKCKPSSWKTCQKLAREGRIRGQKIGQNWRFHKDAVRDFLLSK